MNTGLPRVAGVSGMKNGAATMTAASFISTPA